jgi:hypothetical protein
VDTKPEAAEQQEVPIRDATVMLVRGLKKEPNSLPCYHPKARSKVKPQLKY